MHVPRMILSTRHATMTTVVLTVYKALIDYNDNIMNIHFMMTLAIENIYLYPLE